MNSYIYKSNTYIFVFQKAIIPTFDICFLLIFELQHTTTNSKDYFLYTIYIFHSDLVWRVQIGI